MNLQKMFFVCACVVFAAIGFNGSVAAQQRDRVVKPTASQPINAPAYAQPAEVKTKTTSLSRPVLINPIVIADRASTTAPLVKKTASVSAVNAPAGSAASKGAYGMNISGRIMAGIQERWGIPYRYGSTGPNTYDCSGFVWSVFNEAGVPFTRASARSLWASSEPVYGDDRYKFGTLVFLNGLGHMGIVADENGFYHASSSKGITYSPFKGYWESRVVGFRKLSPAAAAVLKQDLAAIRPDQLP
jgi:cell wall-associated NlpC family hydrolase